MDESHCLSVTATEDSKHANALYDRLHSLCTPETLPVRRSSIPDMIQSNEYTQYCFARNPRCTLSHVTEQFLPEDLFLQLLEDYCSRHTDADSAKIKTVYKLSTTILNSMKVKILLDEDGLHDFALTGMVDFLGEKIHLTPLQRMQCLEYACTLPENNPNLEYRILHGRRSLTQLGMSFPTICLSDSLCYLRIDHSSPVFNISLLNRTKLESMFCQGFEELWADSRYVDATYHSAVEMVRYLMQMVQVQILTEQ
jgi:hypothetical protein